MSEQSTSQPTVEKLENGFVVVPYECVTLNGMCLEVLVDDFESRNHDVCPSAGGFALIAPNGRAVDGEHGKQPHYYRTRDDAREDADTLHSFGECSTCGNPWKKSS